MHENMYGIKASQNNMCYFENKISDQEFPTTVCYAEASLCEDSSQRFQYVSDWRSAVRNAVEIVEFV